MLIEKINKIKSNTDYNKDEINSIIEEADSPEKEVLFIYSNFGKFYSINKDNRIFLVDNFHKILERDLFDRKINNMLYISYIDAQYKDYNYYESEEVYNKMEKFTDPNAIPKEMEFYTLEEWQKFISVIDDIKFK